MWQCDKMVYTRKNPVISASADQTVKVRKSTRKTKKPNKYEEVEEEEHQEDISGEVLEGVENQSKVNNFF